jgi:hypothetical protein
MCSRRGVRAETGRVKGDGGGITLPVGAEIGSGLFLLVLSLVVLSFALSTDERLLDRELFDRGEDGFEYSAGAVDVNEAEDAEVTIDSAEGWEVRAGFSKVKRVLVPVGSGVMSVGDSFERKSRYAAGGVIGVFWLSSCLI